MKQKLYQTETKGSIKMKQETYYFKTQIDGFLELYCCETDESLYMAHSDEVSRIETADDYDSILNTLVSLYEAHLDGYHSEMEDFETENYHTETDELDQDDTVNFF